MAERKYLHCPIREHTADRENVGRCWYFLKGGIKCERHGDVSVAIAKYERGGGLTNDYEHRATNG